MSVKTKNGCKIIATRKGYVLLENGQLWTTGNCAYIAGYVADPDNIETAIFNHEEELHYMLACDEFKI